MFGGNRAPLLHNSLISDSPGNLFLNNLGPENVMNDQNFS